MIALFLPEFFFSPYGGGGVLRIKELSISSWIAADNLCYFVPFCVFVNFGLQHLREFVIIILSARVKVMLKVMLFYLLMRMLTVRSESLKCCH